MTFPQTNPDLAVTNGQEYWRLFGTLESSGDIYESAQSARALVIGPNSDLARVKIIYYDPQNNNLANELIVSIDKPFIGRIDARGDQNYTSGDLGRILISSADLGMPIGDNPFRPPSANLNPNSAVELVLPQIDLLQYFENPPTFIAPRADKVYRFGQLIDITNDQQWFLVPFYGRRFADIAVKLLFTQAGSPPIDVFAYGVNFSWIQADTGVGDDNGHQQEMLGAFHLNTPGTNVLGGHGWSDSMRVDNRSFDYLAIQIQKPVGSANYPIESCVTTHIVTSDKI